MTTSSVKPGRPLGVSLAILMSVLLFCILPLTLVGLYLLTNRQVYIDFETENALGTSGIAAGSGILGISINTLAVQTITGLVFMVIAVFAWRGRPPEVRFVFVAAVLVVTGLALVTNILPAINAQCSQLPCDSGIEANRAVAAAQFPAFVLVPLYVIWYMNRGPARAFYRGYYLPDPEAARAQPDVPERAT